MSPAVEQHISPCALGRTSNIRIDFSAGKMPAGVLNCTTDSVMSTHFKPCFENFAGIVILNALKQPEVLKEIHFIK